MKRSSAGAPGLLALIIIAAACSGPGRPSGHSIDTRESVTVPQGPPPAPTPTPRHAGPASRHAPSAIYVDRPCSCGRWRARDRVGENRRLGRRERREIGHERRRGPLHHDRPHGW